MKRTSDNKKNSLDFYAEKYDAFAYQLNTEYTCSDIYFDIILLIISITECTVKNIFVPTRLKTIFNVCQRN